MSTNEPQNTDNPLDTIESSQAPISTALPEVEQTNETPVHQAAEQQTQLQDTALVEMLDELTSPDVPLPPGFEPIPKEKLMKAKKTRRLLIFVMVLLLLLLFGGIAFSLYYYISFLQPQANFVQDPLVIENDENVLEDRGETETIDMPDLAQMFARTPDEIVALLGDDYLITAYTEAQASSDTNANSDSDQADDTEHVIVQIVTISYSPEGMDSSMALRQNQKIYLSLGEDGTTLEVYFVSSMDILDFPLTNFANLVSSSDSFEQTLAWAGVTIVADTPYTAPTSEEFIEYVDASAQHKKIKKETTSWSGDLVSDTAPTSFEITYTFDYGASGVEDIPDRYPMQRVLYLKLS